MEIVRIITTAMIMVTVSYVVGFIGTHWRMQKYDKNLKTLTQPLLIFGIGLVGFLGCLITILVIFFVVFNEENAAVAIGFFLFMLLYVYLMLYSLNWRITIKEESFIFRNMFGRKKEYMYSEITKVKRIKIGGYKIYIGKKKISVEYFTKGQANLWDILKLL